MSESHYLLGNESQRYFFPSLMFGMIALIAPVWIIINQKINSSYIYLILLVVISFIILGSLKDYRSNKIRRFIHHFAAYVGGITTIVWIRLSYTEVSHTGVPKYPGVILLILFFIIGICTKSTIYSCRYWLELTAFYAIMIVLLFLSLSIL